MASVTQCDISTPVPPQEPDHVEYAVVPTALYKSALTLIGHRLYLYLLRHKAAAPNAVPLNVSAIARALNTDRSSLSRALNDMRRKGLVDVSLAERGRVITVPRSHVPESV